MAIAINREALQIAEAVAREKGIDPEEVLIAMEDAVQKIGRLKYGNENDIRVHIDRKTGHITIERYREVVELLEDSSKQLILEEAHQFDKTLAIGDFLIEPLPPIEFGRVATQAARQVISSRVRIAERDRQYEEFKDKIGEIVTGTVKRMEYGNCMIDVGRTEALLRRDESIPRENLRPGDRIRCYVLDVRPELRGPQVFLSRAHPNFMAKLFYQEVPEIYDGTIEIISVARDPGSRAKIAVKSKDSSIDPVGACVGMRGSRVQAVVNELQGEKVDIVLWSADKATFIINALAPAEITKVVLDENASRVEVVVPEDQQSLAIGRRGQNVRLASLLTNFEISIMTEDQESNRRAEEIKEKSSLFTTALDVDEMIAQLLVMEGFNALEEVAETPLEELEAIDGFDAELASEIQSRAAKFLKAQTITLKQELSKLGVSTEVQELEGLTLEMIVKLGQNNIKTLDDLGDLASDELLELLKSKTLTQEQANDIIMKARAHWFEE
jgi:N utilization substance protein A